jgi:hypothetical protein
MLYNALNSISDICRRARLSRHCNTDAERFDALSAWGSKCNAGWGYKPPEPLPKMGWVADKMSAAIEMLREALNTSQEVVPPSLRANLGAPRKNAKAVDRAMKLRKTKPGISWKDVWTACKNLRVAEDQTLENFKAAVLKREELLRKQATTNK